MTIEKAGDISPAVVARGIKSSTFNNSCGSYRSNHSSTYSTTSLVSKIDSIVNRMEEASISLVDTASEEQSS